MFSLSLVFFLSGVSALIYQIVWQRLLTVYYGVGPISIALIVGVYMMGLGIGAWWGGVLAERIQNKIKLYFLIELLIGSFGLLSLPFLSLLGEKTANTNYIFMFFLMFIFLSFPTFLMGTTLPILTKIFNRLMHNFLDTVGFLYFINTLGAAIGCIVSSYWLISFYGFDTAVYIAAGINIFLAVIIFFLAYRLKEGLDKSDRKKTLVTKTLSDLSIGRKAYLFAFIMGFTAIAYEIIWFRLIGVLTKSSAYSFSSILFMYLLGIALGSLWIKRYVKKYPLIDKKNLLFNLQFLIGLSVSVLILGYYYLTQYTSFSTLTKLSFNLPLHPPFNFILIPHQHLDTLQGFLFYAFHMADVFWWSLFFMFVPTFFMGASFPLVSFLGLSESDQEAKAVGRIYFFNVAGSVTGAFLTGFFLLPSLGSEKTLLILSCVGICWLLLVTKFNKANIRFVIRGIVVFIVLALVVLSFPKKGEIYKIMHPFFGPEYKSYFEEGLDGVVMTYQKEERIINFINGMEHGARPEGYFYFIPIEAMSFSPEIKNVLIIGYGTGSFSEAVLKSNEVENVTVVELSRTLIKNLKKMQLFQDLLSDPRLNLVIEDGRRFLLQNDKKYDLILMDPLKTRTIYSNNIYSKEFFELLKTHLNPDGVIAVWMDEFQVMIRTALSAFEHVHIYGNNWRGFFLASHKPLQLVDRERSLNVLKNFPKEKQKLILETSEESLGGKKKAEEISAGFPINQDLKPINEYYLGRLLYKP